MSQHPFTRRAALALSTAAALSPALPALARAPRPGFVARDGMALTLDGRPYRFAGFNAWYLAWLGAEAAFGDRDRLARELDRLQADGVANLRLAASAEHSPLRNSVRPAFRDASTDYNQTLLVGLDHAMAGIGRRGMKAVLYLTNFWEWSGGMMTYLSWVNGGRYLDMNDPAHPWPAFPNFIADFYRSPEAVGLYHDWVRAMVTRVNTVTGTAYADDPAVMAWQLANEPRPAGGDGEALAVLPDFMAWVNGTARLIKTLDPNHLVSTGAEGLKGAVERPDMVLDTHRSPDIDYLTAHIWPGNWSWPSLDDMAGTDAEARHQTADYIARHIDFARTLNKPLVIEEFGYPRDGNRYDPATPTTLRDRFYGEVHAAVLADARAGGPLVGSNIWAWNGEGRARHPDFRARAGESAWIGDPPHEPQGWYGVFDSDRSTRDLVRAHAAALARV
ncbi:cellulase family glycosylhydrolase [Brevundimonas sp. R86498]|uniref:glycoside hydrolase 5 family protein n=1 Tax=Brevundimonas sp. R86498 TaxID=3093845 RepID=UPI0037C9C910